jgi:hypothetical protein
MITLKNDLYTKLLVNSIYTFPKEISDKDITNTIIHDVVIGFCGLVKEYGESLKINSIPVSMFNTFQYVWNMDSNISSGWECICENKTVIDIVSSEIGTYIDREIINNIFPEDKLIVFYIFKNYKLDNSHIFATYNILSYNKSAREDPDVRI